MLKNVILQIISLSIILYTIENNNVTINTFLLGELIALFILSVITSTNKIMCLKKLS